MSSTRKRFGRYLPHYVMIAPFLVLFTVFYLGPLVFGLGISFTKWDGIHDPTFVGFQNYPTVIRSRHFDKAFLNLAKYVTVTMAIGITVALCLALLVDRFARFGANLFRSAYFMPTVIPLFLTATVWRWILAPDYGILNMAIEGLGGPSIKWLTNPKFMIPACIIVDVWRSSGFNMIILLAGLKGIPTVYYEAAQVDGATPFQQIWFVTLPQLEPVLFMIIVNGFISALQVFDVPWLLSDSAFSGYGGPLQGMMFPVMDIMGRAFGDLKFGQASAYAWLLLMLVLVITLIQFAWRRLRLER
jgi:multiple sugar transport system permease protein